MKIVADQDKCVSSGQCVLNAAEVFDQRDEDGVVVVLTNDPAPELFEGVRNAAAACPAQAIQIEE